MKAERRSHVDIAIIGGGAAGLMAAIWAARTAPALAVVVFDGAKRLGAKILVAGGGRCNVTHDRVDERQYAGSTPGAIKKVLRAFDVDTTIAFFRELGVVLVREPTGKLFPSTNDAHTVLDALLGAARHAGVRFDHPARVDNLFRAGDDFVLQIAGGREISSRRVIVATGGKALPKSGSDGAGYEWLARLGHPLTPRIFPALVPLTLASDHPLCALAGVSSRVRLELRSDSGKRLAQFTGDLLLTHFGISGPVVLDISRYLLDAQAAAREVGDAAPRLQIDWLPADEPGALDAALMAGGQVSLTRLLHERGLVDRLARTLCALAGVEPGAPARTLTKQQRRYLVQTVTAFVPKVAGHRGFTHAEATAGGVPLAVLRLDTMESRLQQGLHLCGEICDVDGQIGGFNFQWAWASGYLAGCGAARGCLVPTRD